MARRIRTLPMASASGKSDFKITDPDWLRIEGAYGQEIQRAARDEILRVTTSFVDCAPFEATAEPLKSARDTVVAWKIAAANLQKKLNEGQSDARAWARSRVKAHFIDVRFQRLHFFDDLSGVLTSFIVACGKTITEADDPNLRGYRKGECWENWVRGLTRVLDQEGSPTGARQDSTDFGKESPFTMLVDALQELVPTNIRCGRASTSALAKAIRRARLPSRRDR